MEYMVVTVDDAAFEQPLRLARRLPPAGLAFAGQPVLPASFKLEHRPGGGFDFIVTDFALQLLLSTATRSRVTIDFLGADLEPTEGPLTGTLQRVSDGFYSLTLAP